ncbi:MAG TPA: WXG100 family type VII secretion target [Pseudonocardiaceae bacterium]|jgi:early secretory antigenic target protein ESAT-6|nr:WXG100 family type VII secretion target [Pseudonocardiaceae bacterium]
MGDEIAVSFGELEALGSQISSTTQQIESELESLKSQIANLNQIWEGSAGSGFQATKAKWDSAAADLTSVLGAIGAAVSAAEEQYRSTESKNTSAWN